MTSTTYTLHLDTDNNTALVRSARPAGVDGPFNRTDYTTDAELGAWLAGMDLHRTGTPTLDGELLDHRPAVFAPVTARPFNR